MRIALGFFRLLIAATLVYVAHDWRAPLFASIRYAVFAGLVLLLLALIAAEFWSLRSPASKRLRVLSLVTLLTTAFALVWTLAIEARPRHLGGSEDRGAGRLPLLLGLHDNGVACTLKHFPGLGRVLTDTHLNNADLDVPLATLAQTDWVPFRALMENQAPFVMLGHVRLTALDTERPASFSPAVIGLLRGDWRFRGVLITDDATMGAFYGSAWGITGGALQALNAGVDLILISYDPDQYFPVMYSLLQAARTGALRADRLGESDGRLSAAAQP
jgi:Glycosyl hydrolase family 3 N terminal domain